MENNDENTIAENVIEQIYAYLRMQRQQQVEGSRISAQANQSTFSTLPRTTLPTSDMPHSSRDSFSFPDDSVFAQPHRHLSNHRQLNENDFTIEAGVLAGGPHLLDLPTKNPFAPEWIASTVPQENVFELQATTGTTHYAYPSHSPLTQALPRGPDTRDVLGERSTPRRNTATPSIRLTTDFATDVPSHRRLQRTHQSATSASSLPPVAAQYLFSPDRYRAHLSLQYAPAMNPDQKEMQTPPRSPRSPQNMNEVAQLPHKRSYEEMNEVLQHESLQNESLQHEPLQQLAEEAHMTERAHSRSGSMNGQSPSDEYESRSHAFKRSDPPMNTQHKFICNFAAECEGITFDRKCEWSKHMDKHDRPYRCGHPSCAKLQGFTYSGGLLRHEREVHGKHGGPKEALMCPHSDCKRHGGKGFTRKENLNEHLRRVHNTKEQPSPAFTLTRDMRIIPVADEYTAAPAVDGIYPDDAIEPSLKRRRYEYPDPNGQRSASEEMEDLKQELRRLQDENSQKDTRLMEMELRLEEERSRRNDDIVALQEQMRQLQQSQQPTQVSV